MIRYTTPPPASTTNKLPVFIGKPGRISCREPDRPLWILSRNPRGLCETPDPGIRAAVDRSLENVTSKSRRPSPNGSTHHRLGSTTNSPALRGPTFARRAPQVLDVVVLRCRRAPAETGRSATSAQAARAAVATPGWVGWAASGGAPGGAARPGAAA